MIIKHVPNTITCLNLFSGCLAVVAAFNSAPQLAFILILIAALFDFMDGLAARMLHAYSAIGKELDSLSDLVSFGFAPAVIVFNALSNTDIHESLTYFAFIIVIFSALRLAKFNIDERQTTSFIGLPTPANAIFWGGLFSIYSDFMVSHPYLIIGLIAIMSLLLVAEIPLFSLKFKSLKWGDNVIRYIFLIGCIALFATLQLASFVWIIVWYIALSITIWIVRKVKK